MRMRTGYVVVLAVMATTGLSGCHVFKTAKSKWNSCLNDNGAVYMKATSVPGLKTPAGLDSPDTRNTLKIPELNEPAPPARELKDPCMDEPPKYADPARGPRPVPAA